MGSSALFSALSAVLHHQQNQDIKII